MTRDDVGRRAFVGTLVAGAPLFGGLVIHAQDGRGLLGGHGAHAAGAGSHADPVLEQICREMVQVYNRMIDRGPAGEDLRMLASAERLMSARLSEMKFDTTLRSFIAENRQRILAAPGRDRSAMRDVLRRYGMKAPRPAPSLDRSELVPALDALATNGATAKLLQMADLLDAVAPEVDARRAAVRTVALREYDYCRELKNDIRFVNALVDVVCLLAIIDPLLEPVCAAALAALATLEVLDWWWCEV